MRRIRAEKGSWRAKAQEVIVAAARRGLELGLKGSALRRYVSAQYPFQVRKFYPYKVWCEELDLILDDFNDRSPQQKLPLEGLQ